MGQHEKAVLEQVRLCMIRGFYSAVQLSVSEMDEIACLLRTARDNDGKQTKFPDFVCDNGWIEHFETTFGKIDTCGGYENKRCDNAFVKGCVTQMLSVKPNESGFIVRHVSNDLPVGSYDNFRMSYRRVWSKHIDSFRKSGIDLDTKNIGMFLMELDFRGVVVHCVDSKGQLVRYPYNLMFDREFLDFIYDSRNIVKYLIVYSNFGVCEVLPLDRIPDLKQQFPDDVQVRFDSVIGKQMYTLIGFNGGENDGEG